MKLPTQRMLAALLAAAAGACATMDAAPPKSLRGADVPVADTVFQERNWLGRRPGNHEGIARTYSTQPPLIPHAVENFDEVSLSENQCVECHGAEGAKKRNAPVVGEKHFVPGSRTVLAQARYACVMCHVPQSDAPPLVENRFVGDRIVQPAPKQ